MPACTDRVSQAPDDPFDSARGPSLVPLSSMVGVRPEQRLLYVCSPSRICNSFKPALSVGGIVSRGPGESFASDRPIHLSSNGLGQRRYVSDLCRRRVRFVQSLEKHSISPYVVHGVDGLDLQTVNQLSGTELLDGSVCYKGLPADSSAT